MAEDSGSFKIKKPGDVNMEQQVVVAIVAMMAVLLISQLVFKPQKGPQPTKPNQSAQTKTGAAPPQPPLTTPGIPAPSTPGGAPTVRAEREQIFTIDTGVARIEFTNHGALARSWKLKKYQDSKGQPLDLIGAKRLLGHYYLPFSLRFPSTAPAFNPNDQLYQVQSTADGLGADFDYSDGITNIHKSFRFEKGSYLARVQTQATRNGAPLVHLIEWRGGFGDEEAQNAPAAQHAVFYDGAGKLNRLEPKAAKDGTVTNAGGFAYAGADDRYFSGVFLPTTPGASMEIETFSDQTPRRGGKPEETDPVIGFAIANPAGNQFRLFVGPKDRDLLIQTDQRMLELVDFGWARPLASPLAAGLNWLVDRVTGGTANPWGWGIVLLTVVINMMLLPFRISSLRSAKKMQALQPLVNAINERYKGMSNTDPRKQKQSEELMGLYTTNGVNPLGGCLPLLPQLPIFFSLNALLSNVIELRGATWLWVHDLSQPETFPIRFLPCILVGCQFASQQLTPTSPAMDRTQQTMLKLMPLYMGFVFWNLPSGLGLYYLTSTLVGIGQQLVFNQIFYRGDGPGSKTKTISAPPRSGATDPKSPKVEVISPPPKPKRKRA